MNKRQGKRYWLLCVMAVSLISSCCTALLLTNYYGKTQFQMMGNIGRKVIEEQPLAKQAVMKALKDCQSYENVDIGRELLEDFGYRESDFLGPVWKNILFIALGGCGIGVFLLISAFWYWNRKNSAKIRDLTEYLEKVNTGGTGLVLETGEDDFSRLQDEMYKTVTMLKQTKDNALKAKNHFAENLSNIAHQLKTPITAISLSNQMMRIHPELQYADQIERQLGRLTHLEEALLLLSRIDAGTLSLESQIVDVFTLLTLAADNLQEIANERRVLIDVPDRGEVEIKADLEWTMEAVMNLMKNCVEHTPEKGSVHCSYEQNPLYVEIMIWDEGEGFEKEDMPHLFERFYRGKNAKDKGIGIGLPLAKAILEMQNGIVCVKNLPSGGACFEVRVYSH